MEEAQMGKVRVDGISSLIYKELEKKYAVMNVLLNLLKTLAG